MDLKLPSAIATKQQLITLIHDVESSIDDLTQAQIRARETKTDVNGPQVKQSVAALLDLNGVELTAANLEQVQKKLRYLKDKAPTIRFVFASEPSAQVLDKLINWFRENSRMMVLMQVGIQPQIAVGCILETPGRRYDFSLRKKLAESSSLIEALRNGL